MEKTIKIKKFIDEKAGIFLNNKKYVSSFVNKIKKKLEELNFGSNKYIDLNIVHKEKDTIIQKANNNMNEPLLYKICKELKYSDDKISDYEKFLVWYRKNSKNIKLRNIIDRSSYNKILHVNERNKLNKLLYDNNFCSLDIIHCGEIYDLRYNEYTHIHNNAKTNIFAYTIMEEDNPNITFIIKIINLMREISKKNLDVELTIFLCHQKRYLNKNKKLLLTPENINAGSTLVGEFIYIWRKEEFYKVLIHELTHYFMLDFNDCDNSHIEKTRNNIININGDDVINETYTEIFAITIYNIFYSLINKIDFNTIINYENLFTHFQIAKIINYFGGKEYDDLFKIEIKQSTSVVSYVIIKGMFLNNYDKFLQHLDNHFDSDRKTKYEDYQKLYKLVVKKDSLNKDIINHFLDIIKNDTEYTDKFIMKTLRMTMFDV